jgi:hypothetical protein
MDEYSTNAPMKSKIILCLGDERQFEADLALPSSPIRTAPS